MSLFWFLICMIWYPCKSLRVLGFVWPTRSMILAMGEVLGFGFIPCGDLSQWQKGQQGTHRVVAIKCNKMGFHSRYEIVHLHHVILLKALLCSFGLNTLDACWIAVDVWSNSSRCTQYRSTCFGRDAYRYNHCHRWLHDFTQFYLLLDSNLFTHRLLAFMREATSKHYSPRVYSHLSFPLSLLLRFVTLLLSVLTWRKIYKGLTTPS